MIAALFFLTLAIVASPAQAAPPAYSLESCYQLALKRSETVAGRVELIKQAEERILQARAPFFPSVNVLSDSLRQEDDSPGFGRDIFPSEQRNTRTNASINLFRGFKDMAAVRERRFREGASRSAYEQAKVQLFQDTSQAFYEVLSFQQDLENYRLEIEANKQRKGELLHMQKFLRAREADIASIDSAIAVLEAGAANTTGLLLGSREALSYLTGLGAEVSLADSEPYPEDIGPPERWLQNLEERPDIAEARQNLLAAKRNIDVAKGDRWPSVDVGSNYYLDRSGLTSEVDWDVGLSVSVPVFEGGAIESRIREAISKKNEEELRLGDLRRLAQREIQTQFEVLRTGLEEVTKLSAAAKLSRKNYELRLVDSRRALASNVDVLQALVVAYQVKRSYDRKKILVKLDHARLAAISANRDLSGGLPEADPKEEALNLSGLSLRESSLP